MAKFYCIGIGTGEGGYITLGALRAIEKADIIFTPVKRNGAKSTALEIIRQEINIEEKEISQLEFPMSADREIRKQSRVHAAEKVISELKKGRNAAMITLGDVSIYSTASYVFSQVREAGYEADIIAGVPSFCAAADKAGISLLEENAAAAIIPSPDINRIEKYINEFDTIIIMKARGVQEDLYELLEKRNMLNSAVVCSEVGMDGESIGAIKKGKNYGYFTTIIIKKNIDKANS